jgi:hypothetical protein
VERVRWQICEGELIQNFARPRPIRRGADRPVEILILTNVPLALPVDHLTTWDELVPDRLEVVGARGVVLDNNADLARAYPDLFKDTEAAKNARRRRAARTVSFPYNKVSIGKRHGPPTEVHYQLAGKGQKLKRAYYCPDQVADIRAWLTDKLGAVTVFEVVGVESTAKGGRGNTKSSKIEEFGASEYGLSVARPVSGGFSLPIIEEIPAASPDVPQDNDPYDGGLLTDDLVRQIRAIARGSGLKQDQIAARIGISRPQLTNALAQRFGLGGAPARELMEFLAAPPPTIQPALF